MGRHVQIAEERRSNVITHSLMISTLTTCSFPTSIYETLFFLKKSSSQRLAYKCGKQWAFVQMPDLKLREHGGELSEEAM